MAKYNKNVKQLSPRSNQKPIQLYEKVYSDELSSLSAQYSDFSQREIRRLSDGSPGRTYRNIYNLSQLDPFSKNLYVYVVKYVHLISHQKRKEVFYKYMTLDTMADSNNNMDHFLRDIKRSSSVQNNKSDHFDFKLKSKNKKCSQSDMLKRKKKNNKN